MAYYQNRPNHQSLNQPLPPTPPGQYGTRRNPTFDDVQDGGFGPLGQGYHGGDYGVMGDQGDNGREDDELLFDHRGPRSVQSVHNPASTFVQSPASVYTARSPYPTYDPRQYAQQPVQYEARPRNLVGGSYTSGAHQPYNPAAYQDPSLDTHGSSAGYGQGTSFAWDNPLPPLPRHSQTAPMPYVTEEQQAGTSRPQSIYGPRQSLQSVPERVQAFQHSPPQPPQAIYPSPSSAPLPMAPYHDLYSSESWRAVLPGRQPSASQGVHSYTNTSTLPHHFQTNFSGAHSLQSIGSRPGSLSGISQAVVPPPVPPYALPSPSPPPPTPPEHSPQRIGTFGRHPQSRPLPGPPSGASHISDYFTLSNGRRTLSAQEDLDQDELFNEVEEALMRSTGEERGQRWTQGMVEDGGREFQRSSHSEFIPFPAHMREVQNGSYSGSYTQPQTFSQHSHEDTTSDENDAEADAGLEAMRIAEAEDQAEQTRRESGVNALFSAYGSQNHGSQRTHLEEGSDSDFVAGVDVGLYGGGHEGHLSYGGGPSDLARGQSNVGSSASPSHDSSAAGSLRERAHTYGRSTLPFPEARVDIYGTGGLSEPTAHRLSFDEGDENGFFDEQAADFQLSDGFYYPGVSENRPLPQVPQPERRTPPRGTYGHERGLQSAYSSSSPDTYHVLNPSTTVPVNPNRASSLVTRTSTPPVPQPLRSLTAAEQRREWQRRARQAGMATPHADALHDMLVPQNNATSEFDLPTIPSSKRFIPSKLGPSDFKRCSEPWAASSVVTWVKALAEGETDLRQSTIAEALVLLFTFKVATMQLAEAEALSARLTLEMLQSGVLVQVEEWVKFGQGSLTGVFFQLTGLGCYASRLHDQEISGKCYAHHCQRTLKKLILQTQLYRPSEDWETFYRVKKEDLEGVDKTEVVRQHNLHEIVQTEEDYLNQLHVLLVLYRDALLSAQPPIISPKRREKFLQDVFGKADATKRANEDFLLAQLKYRQEDEGPFISGFSDIFREWIRKAKHAYIDYAAAFPKATFLVRQEAERNILFQNFLDKVRSNERSKRLGWDTYLKAPITRLQRYGLLLSTAHKNMVQDSEEKANLQIAMDEVKAVALECDARVAEMSRKVDLEDLKTRLVLRPGMERVELNLDHLGRELLHKGDLQRTGMSRYNWLDMTALLFDHYLVLAKTVMHHDSSSGLRYERYDVSKLPIPMDLLVLESTNDPPVEKSSVKGFSAVKDLNAVTGTSEEPRLTKSVSISSTAQGSLSHTNATSSILSPTANPVTKSVTNLPADAAKDDKIFYPFRIRHLGKEVYTLYASSERNRRDWCKEIIDAKTKHAASLFAQNAEPFRLRVLADSAFAYDSQSGGQKNIVIKGTPLDRAIDEVERRFADKARPGPVCRAKVNCATTFAQQYGKRMVAVGTDYGVFLSEIDSARGWNRAIQTQRVTQIAILEEFSLILLIQDKNLVAYHLDTVCPVNGTVAANDSARKAPQKLSGSRDVSFFATGRMKDRLLVFYKKREGLSSTFKVLEPVYQKSTERKSRLLRTGTTEFFREYDSFYIPAECAGLNLFSSSLAICSARGFEVLTLDKKIPISVPDLKLPDVASIAARLASQSPLGMFRLNGQEFLLVYEECAVYVNKHGDISRSVIMEFVGKAKAACVKGRYLCLFDGDFVEVRNAEDGRLRQVVAGRDVKFLDDGGGGDGAGSVKFSMQHPTLDRCQLVLEFVLNEGQKE